MFARPRIAISPVSATEATGDITLVVTPHPADDAKFPPNAVVMVDGAGESYIPAAATRTARSLTVTVPNDTRAVGLYTVQLRYEDGRITPPVNLEILAA